MKAQRGFTLVEVLISLVIFVTLSFALLGVLNVFVTAVTRSAATQGGTLALEQQADTMRSDAASAFAVFVPSKDVFGASNAASHEVDFYSKGNAGSPVFWANYYDAGAQTLRRYDYDTAGHVGAADRTTGAIDVGETYPPVTGVTSFSAQTLEAADLTGAKSAYGSSVSQLFGSKAPQSLPVGYDDGAAQRTDLYGGNTTVEVTIGSARGARTLHLSSAVMPSGFTIHEHPELRAIVYRVDSTHRSWLGLVQSSKVYIQARLVISWDNFATTQTWCDYNIYGYPDGLRAPFRGNDQYHPDWYVESTAGIVDRVVNGHTTGSTCSKTPPNPGVNPAQLFSPPPSTADTPPPCFMEGQCWPPNAPVNWDPSPAPPMSPPPAWCQTHDQSPLCGAPVPTAAPSSGPTPQPHPSITPINPCLHGNDDRRDVICGPGGNNPIPQ